MTFDPSEQRDKSGKWTAGGADGLPPLTLREFTGIGSQEFVRERADVIAKQMGFDPKRIDISEDQPTFELNGKPYHTGGIAETNKPEGEGRIVIYRQNVRASELDGVIIHEIEHMKFQTVLNKYQAERQLALGDTGPAPDPNGKYWWEKKGGIDAVFTPNDSLRDTYESKYPVYAAMHDVMFKYGMTDDFGRADGVSPYSYDWWNASVDGKATPIQAMHETLAEMARIKQTTGNFPDHMGPRIMSYRQKLQLTPEAKEENKPMSKADIAKGTKLWRDLYRTVEKLSK